MYCATAAAAAAAAGPPHLQNDLHYFTPASPTTSCASAAEKETVLALCIQACWASFLQPDKRSESEQHTWGRGVARAAEQKLILTKIVLCLQMDVRWMLCRNNPYADYGKNRRLQWKDDGVDGSHQKPTWAGRGLPPLASTNRTTTTGTIGLHSRKLQRRVYRRSWEDC